MTRLRKSLVVFAVSVLPHLYGITSPALDYHYHRQTQTATTARNYHTDGLPFFHPRINWNGNDNGLAGTEFPAYMWLVGLFWGVFGLGELWGRILSVLFSGLTAVVLYHFLARWLEDGAAFWGSLLFSVLPVELYFGRTIQPEALALLCYVAALWSFDRYLQDEPPKTLWGAVAALSAGLSIGLKIPYAHLWLILAFLMASRKGWSSIRDVRLWLMFLVSAFPVAAWYQYIQTANLAAPNREIVPTTFQGLVHLLDYTQNLRLLGYYSFYQLFSRFPEITATYAGLVFFAFGAWVMYRRRLWFPLLWWLAVLLYVIAGGGYTFHHEYTALPFAPVNAALMGAGFWALRRRALEREGRKRIQAFVVLAALVLAIPVNTFFRIVAGPMSGHWYRINYPFLLTLRPVINRLSSPDDLFVCNNRAPSVYLYYIDRKGWSWDVGELGEERLGIINDAVRRGAKFFLTEKNMMFRDKTNPVTRHFYGRYPVAYEDSQVLIFRLLPPAKKLLGEKKI